MSPTEPSAAVYLDFSRDVLTSTTISLRRNDKPVYEVSSEHGLSTTYVHRGGAPGSEPPLAMLARGALVLPDYITLRGRAPMKVNVWLKPAGVFSTIPATMSEGGAAYTWRKNDAGLLSLWSGDAQLAWFQPAVRRLVDGKSVLMPAYVALQEAAVVVQDAIVISCLVLAQRLRRAQKGDDCTASSVTGPIM
ncbi:hypothetical protein DFH09DRAFT_1081269 [Mycena vulgaris]|nr:hypothetical protein DFH09DRAFT_1081269 [Mycena vulgaris]